MAKMDINIEVMEDGVYLTVSRTNESEKVDVKALMDKIEEFEVKDVDIEVIQEFANSEDIVIRKKITDNLDVKSVDEGAIVKIVDNKMRATMAFTRPVNKGSVFTREDIMKILNDSNVKAGIDETEINDIVENRQYDYEYQVAFGKESKEGKDGYIKYNFDTNKRTLKPVLLEDGTVDYFNLNLYQQAKSGDVLAEKVDPVAGENGYDVTGNPIQAKIGKIAGNLPNGKNVQVSPDGIYTIATCDGQIEYRGGKININEVLTLKEVNNSTGNIEYNGSVVVEGNVFSGFSVIAKGNIEIFGICEGAHIESQADIFLHAGVMGHEKAEIIAEGDITAKFIDSATVSAGGSIATNSVMHSDVDCVKNLVCSGKNGLLVGGRICVGEKIEASIIGAPMATVTILEVGSTPSRLASFRALEESLTDTIDNIFKTDQMIKVLKASQNELTPEKKNLLLKSYHTKIHLIEKKTKTEQQLAEIYPTLQNDNGMIIASKILYSGCKILIGGSKMTISEDYRSVKVRKIDEKIDISLYIAN